MKIYIDTLGCPKNINDSQQAAGALEAAGHVMVDGPTGADVVMVNTCGFINDAKKESIDRIFQMAREKDPGAKLIVSGCLSQRYGKELYEEIPEADLIVGVNEYDRLPVLLADLETSGQRTFAASPAREKTLTMPTRKLPSHPYTATIKIAEGCNNACTYCSIPAIRGPFRSKTKEDVLAEAQALAQAGCVELTLIAQDTACYGLDLYGHYALPELLRSLCQVEGIRWIRLLYCYDDKITDELIATMAAEEKICHYIDIPIQHADDQVLREMNRNATRDSLEQTIRRLRAAMPDIHIRTTLIVGFPGETEAAYESLVDFVETERFERLGVFAYSQEENTPAGRRTDQIDEAVKEQRLDGIMRRQMDISLAHNQKKVGQVLEVIVDGVEPDGSYVGRTRYDAPEIDNGVLFTSAKKHLPGDLVQVRILAGFDYDMQGEEV